MLTMKKIQRVLSALFLYTFAAAIFAGALFADDSGDERVVEIQEYKCLMCDVDVITFVPDALDRKEHMERDYQVKEWFMLKDSSKPFIEYKDCKLGGHIFEKKGSKKIISPIDVYKLIDSFIVLRSGGTINSAIQEVECALCGKKDFWCFEGDDMDLYKIIRLDSRLNVWCMKGGSQISECNRDLIEGCPQSKAHIFRTRAVRSTSSYSIAKNLSKFFFSN